VQNAQKNVRFGQRKKGAAQIFMLFCYLAQYFTLIKHKNKQNNQTFA